jgi:nitrite reductase/ring-hydroxylating ferredoxin subunit
MKTEHPALLSRGKFIQLCTRIALSLAGGLGLIGLIRYFSHRPQSGPLSTYHLGPLDEFPGDGTLLRLDIPAVIYQTSQGFQAYSLICTHLGCTLEEKGAGFSCPCHGSEFGADGTVIKGPAQADLDSLEVEVTDSGDLLLHNNGAGL